MLEKVVSIPLKQVMQEEISRQTEVVQRIENCLERIKEDLRLQTETLEKSKEKLKSLENIYQSIVEEGISEYNASVKFKFTRKDIEELEEEED